MCFLQTVILERQGRGEPCYVQFLLPKLDNKRKRRDRERDREREGVPRRWGVGGTVQVRGGRDRKYKARKMAPPW